MNAPQAHRDWIQANQQLLVAELARLKHRLAEGDDTAELEDRLQAARTAMPAPAAIDRLVAVFGLSPFEREILLLCAGVEMDAKLAAAGPATFALALARLAEPHWSALTPGRPLRRWRLVEVADEAGLAAARLRIDERILHYLAGINALDARLVALLRPVAVPEVLAETHRRAAAALRDLWSTPVPSPIQLVGDDPTGHEDVAAAAAAELGLQLYRIAVEDLATGPVEMDAFATLWAREAALQPAALLVAHGPGSPGAAPHAIGRLVGPHLISAAEPVAAERTPRRLRVDRPAPAEQRGLWQHCLGDGAPALAATLDTLAVEFSLSARAIGETAAALGDPQAPETAARLRATCCEQVRLRLDDLAHRIEPAADWADLILPEAQQAALRQIAAHQRHRLTVLETWGFAAKGRRGLGLGALFAGESGTGKTMAGEVLASALGLDLYRIDLAGVVSKYIGETEKNLRRVFDAAEDGGAILLFDEADALFGRRGEVKDSHDRYANIEVGYLLQRMEAYRGIAILTTNHKAALDTAFQRRLRFIVQFPFPDAAQREAIWRHVFPAATPLAGLDYARLAQLHVAGGSIRNIALTSAFLAAEAGTPVTMELLRRAAHLEAAKREQPLTDAETRGWT
ncbi:AAA+ family ATPase [Thioflavicoccus mobilis 8321]|uniref:AAA+ family ATPase n=1 Tax=Thioflavicoccus mobilis 8321 TaxID=765912 RepID=L0GS95_9GAMM|nr:ATP-binding protein [Thioflavicoccus mobilis]AGA89623.1 AAA+ family ATPase [Thioflavicoccus mobilis 8321]